jgi:hypothetical protein
MSTLKQFLIAIAVAGVLAGLLFATGVVSVSGRSSGDEEDDGASADGEGAGKGARRGKGKRKKKGKREGTAEDLDSLGYLGAIAVEKRDLGKVGVTKHLQERVEVGYGIYNHAGWGPKYTRLGGKRTRQARLIDMKGTIVHEWSNEFPEDGKAAWDIAKLSDEGELYAVVATEGMVKLDWDSNLIWGLRGRFHHDVLMDAKGKLWAGVERDLDIDHEGEKVAILDNGIAVVSADGVLEREIWFSEILKDNPVLVRSLARRAGRNKPKGKPIDLLHLNTVDFMPSDFPGRWKKGDIITSFREISLIGVFDRETGAPRWTFGEGELQRQHDPSPLPNGNILIFDNGTSRRHWSRVIELDPKGDGSIVWTYRGTSSDPFWSIRRGLAQRLANGNTVITSSERGRVFEVDAEGEILWEFWSPYLLADGKYRVPIRYIRLEGAPLEYAKKKLGDGADAGGRSAGN